MCFGTMSCRMHSIASSKPHSHATHSLIVLGVNGGRAHSFVMLCEYVSCLTNKYNTIYILVYLLYSAMRFIRCYSLGI